MINCWERYLKTTGGTIRLDKSFIYLINFNFKPNRAYYFEQSNVSSESLLVKNEFKQRKNLELVEASEGRDSLGIK